MSDENLEVIDFEKPKSKYDIIIKSKLVELIEEGQSQE